MARAAACARTHGALRSAGLRPLLDFQTTAVRAHAKPPTLAVHGRPCCAQGRLPKLREPSRKLPKQKLSTTKARGQRTSRAPSSVKAHAHRSCRKRRRISRTNERTRTAALERDRARPRYPATPKACHRRGLAPGRELPFAGDRWSRLAQVPSPTRCRGSIRRAPDPHARMHRPRGTMHGSAPRPRCVRSARRGRGRCPAQNRRRGRLVRRVR